jgi:hypothetical protein
MYKKYIVLLTFILCNFSLYAHSKEGQHHYHHHHGGIVHHREKTPHRLRRHHFAHHPLGKRWQDRHKKWIVQHHDWRHERFQRHWWHSHWWGPGESAYPWYWLTSPVALRLGLVPLAEAQDWDEIYYRINKRLDTLEVELERVRMENPDNQERIYTLEEHINVLESFIQDADVYRSTSVKHEHGLSHNAVNYY